ncbi:hypothetical protein FRB95_006487 [Tulasnella sp. JGI-2019a]|nr:hypothetical protein FRB95_006487 [Tulasnella sp. JGI-2019a]
MLLRSSSSLGRISTSMAVGRLMAMVNSGGIRMLQARTQVLLGALLPPSPDPSQSSNVVYSRLKLSSVSNNASIATANSDGIDIYRSNDVLISGWTVNNDDDCVSFKPNSTNIIVNNMNCNGSHGISVGSLGQYAGETDIVSNIYVNDIVMANAQNGARIKVFPGNPNAGSVSGGGSGYVKNITFENFKVQNVDYPILIDQCYNVENATFCAEYPSKLSISDVHYINVHGTSSGKNNNTVAQLECSALCQDITAKQTKLTPPANYTSAQYLCRNIASTSSLDFNCTAPPS